MEKRELLDKMETFSQQFMETLAEMDAIKRQVRDVLEENARLRLENTKLREYIIRITEPASDKTYNKGKGHLESIYEEGFHVCNVFYGQHRNSAEECMWCTALLGK